MIHKTVLNDYLTLAPSKADAGELWLRMGILERYYNEPHRAYHNLVHILFGYSQHQQFFGAMDAPTFFAWTYHDAIYNPQASDNEERSARLFLCRQRRTGLQC